MLFCHESPNKLKYTQLLTSWLALDQSFILCVPGHFIKISITVFAIGISIVLYGNIHTEFSPLFENKIFEIKLCLK